MAAGPLFSKPISGNNRHSWSIALTATHSIYSSSPVEIQCAQIRSTIAKRIEPIIINAALRIVDTLEEGGGERCRFDVGRVFCVQAKAVGVGGLACDLSSAATLSPRWGESSR